MILHTLKSGSGQEIIFLHGLFGDGKNLYPISRELENHYTCLLADQRNHGKSQHADDFSYSVLAADVKESVDDSGIGECIILGHSMGAKTAMEFALAYPEKTKALICMDSSPGRYDMRYDNFVKSMNSMDLLNIRSREDAFKYLTSSGINASEARFLLKNLFREGKSYRWRINLHSLINNYENIWAPIRDGRSYSGPVLFLKGRNSDFIKPADHDLITELFPHASIKVIEEAGHWLHVDNPAQCVSEIMKFLSGIPAAFKP